MDALRAEFEALLRPAGLPPPGEPLPREEVAVDQVLFFGIMFCHVLGVPCFGSQRPVIRS